MCEQREKKDYKLCCVMFPYLNILEAHSHQEVANQLEKPATAKAEGRGP